MPTCGGAVLRRNGRDTSGRDRCRWCRRRVRVVRVERGTVDDPTVGELIAINIHPEHWRHGLGRLLLRHVTAQLAGLGFGAAVLWVVAENVRARAFYEAESWRFDGTTRVDTVQGATVNEVRFARDLPRPNGLDQR